MFKYQGSSLDFNARNQRSMPGRLTVIRPDHVTIIIKVEQVSGI